MVSAKSLKWFAIINTSLFSVGYLQYNLLSWYNFHPLAIWISIILENTMIYTVYSNISSDKKYITEGIRLQKFEVQNFIQISLLFAATLSVSHYVTTGPPNDYMYEILTFIPRSFAFELLFDLFHYTSHRISHSVPFLYRNVHKKHHEHRLVDINTTYNHTTLDIICTVAGPFLLTATIIPVSDYSIIVMYWYKTIIEHVGHSGKESSSSFIQCIWLPKLFGIELYTHDHNLHHIDGRYNFAKRFVLWDKLFGTYKQTREILA